MSTNGTWIRRLSHGAISVAVVGGLVTFTGAPAAYAEDNCPGAKATSADKVSKSHLWAQDLLDPERVWNTTTGSGVKVAVIDSGIEAGLSIFGDRVSGGKAWVKKSEDEKASGGDDATEDCDGHGTSVAGIIAGDRDDDNGVDFSGMAPGAELVPYRIASQRPSEEAQDAEKEEESSEDPAVTENEFADAINTAVSAKAKVINLSVKYGDDHGPIKKAIDNAVNNDVVVVAAAGNEGNKANPTPTYPAAYEHEAVLGVGAVDKTLTRVETSQEGPWVDVVAPGADLAAPLPDGKSYDTQFGATSAATAFVSGTAALLREQHPKWKASDVAKHIMGTASTTPGGSGVDNSGKSQAYGYGLVDPYRAVTENLHHDKQPDVKDELDRPDVDSDFSQKSQFFSSSKSWALWITLGSLAFFAATLTGVAALRRGQKHGWRAKKVDRESQVEHFDDGDPIPLFQGIKGLKR